MTVAWASEALSTTTRWPQPILGRPVGMLLLALDATVTFCYSKLLTLPRLFGAPTLSWPHPDGPDSFKRVVTIAVLLAQTIQAALASKAI